MSNIIMRYPNHGAFVVLVGLRSLPERTEQSCPACGKNAVVEVIVEAPKGEQLAAAEQLGATADEIRHRIRTYRASLRQDLLILDTARGVAIAQSIFDLIGAMIELHELRKGHLP